MKNKKFILILFLGTIIGLLLWRFFSSSKKSDAPRFSIAVLQTLSHPALDLVVKNFSKSLKNELGNEISVTVFNGQGVISTIHTIAQRISNQEYNLAVTVGTAATQALYNCNGTVPIMFAAVTDVAAIGSFDRTRMTGITDMIDLKKQVQLVKDLMPRAASIGIINNPSDPGSIIQYQRFVELFTNAGYKVLPVVVQGVQDLGVAINQAVRSIDVLVVPVDNVIAIGISQVISITDQYKIPVIVSDALLVSSGALGGCGVDYGAIGTETAHRAAHYLFNKGSSLADFPIQSVSQSLCHINKKRFDLLFPSSFQFNYPVVWD
jgi:putative ABC transport system substrate-binding protein